MSRLPGQFKFYPDGHWDDWPSFLMYSSGSPGDGGGGDGGGGGEPQRLPAGEAGGEKAGLAQASPLADRVGFEPTVGSHLRRFSRPLP